MNTDPAVNLARRVIRKFSLTPPIDAEALLRRYARIDFEDIPFEGMDGISLNIKVPGKQPIVIVNTNTPPRRQRFTLAHELGHILIPWHVGTIVDDTTVKLFEPTTDYWSMETEANAFAAELLMPKSWIKNCMSNTSDFSAVHKTISEVCKASAHSAAIKLAQVLPKNIVFASERGGKVEFSGRTVGTLANSLIVDTQFSEIAFDYCSHHYISALHNRNLHWWILPEDFHVDSDDDRSWREILDCILHDSNVSNGELPTVKQSISGVVGSVYGTWRRSGTLGVDSLVAAFKQRFNYRPRSDERFGISEIVKHEHFDIFLKKRAEALADKAVKQR